jgi:bla regulator protein blaR1
MSRFCIEPPPVSAAGITGGEWRMRARHIMTHSPVRRVRAGCRVLLPVTSIIALAVPLAFGLMHPIQSPHIDAQSDGKGETEFDVASIRANKSQDFGARFAFTADGFNATNISLIMLLKLAYGVEEDQIVGLPRWVQSERFDIAAKVLGKDLRKLSIEQRKHMIRSLLADRFQLRFHEVEKSVPVYTLVISKNGSKLRSSKPGSCSLRTEQSQTLRMVGRGYVLGLCVPMELITQMLVDQLGRPVIDRTGLKGNFDFALHWTPDEEVPFRGHELSPQQSTGPDSEWPTLFTAVNEQLGLRLKGEKGPAGAIAIDHLEEPSAN